MKKIIIASGYYNPVHIGHIDLFREAKKIGDFLIVIVNSDTQVKIKGSVPFMPESERLEIIKALKDVDEVFLSIDKDRSVCESLKAVAKAHPDDELFFGNGGDRHTGNIPEVKVCEEFNIKLIDGLGPKIQSSSWLLKNAGIQKDYGKE